MRPIQIIRSRLGVSQAELADGIKRSQTVVSYYERGGPIPAAVATNLIAFAREKGLELTYDHVYGAAEIPRSAHVVSSLIMGASSIEGQSAAGADHASSDDETQWLRDFRRQHRALVVHCRSLEHRNTALEARNAELERQLCAIGGKQASQSERAPGSSAGVTDTRGA